MIMNDDNGRPSTKELPVEIHTSLTVTESNGYWVAWGYLADNPSSEQLKKVRVVFKDGDSDAPLWPFDRDLAHNH